MSRMWFKAADGHGYTAQPEFAQRVTLKDGTECVVIAPGDVRGYLRDMSKNREKLWDYLLDCMEVGDPSRTQALEEALAVLSYGELNETSLALIRAQANVRYDQES